MNSDALFKYVYGLAEKVNVSIVAMRTHKPLGFAIPLPQEPIVEEVKREVDRKLSGMMWTFHRCMIGGKEYYVLFPFGD